MQALATKREDFAKAGLWTIGAATTLRVNRLTQEDEAEVLAFLAERPVHTFGMVGFIHANGLVSPHNRGAFYACRDEVGRLEGVALIGHYILFETRTDAAIEAFAQVHRLLRHYISEATDPLIRLSRTLVVAPLRCGTDPHPPETAYRGL